MRWSQNSVLVRKLLSLASPQARDEISRALAKATDVVASETERPRESTLAEHIVRLMHSEGKLDDAAVSNFAECGKFDEVTAAVAVLCSTPLNVVSELIMGARNDAVLLPCKAAGLEWLTVETILRNRRGREAPSSKIMDIARNDFRKLSIVTAQKALRFMQIRTTVSK
jgi:hypothetical protein